MSRTITLSVVLYGCEIWSLKRREKGRVRLFENKVLRRIFGPKRDEVTGEWRKLHNEELNDLYSSSNIVRVIKSRRMRLAMQVARMGKRRGAYRVLVGEPEWERDHLEDPSVHRRIISRWIFRMWDAGHGLDSSISGQGQVVDCCKRGNEPSGSIRCGKFLN